MKWYTNLYHMKHSTLSFSGMSTLSFSEMTDLKKILKLVRNLDKSFREDYIKCLEAPIFLILWEVHACRGHLCLTHQYWELLRKISFYFNDSAIGISFSLVKTMLSYDIHWTRIVYAIKSEK